MLPLSDIWLISIKGTAPPELTLLKTQLCQTAETALFCGAAPCAFMVTRTDTYCVLLRPGEPVSCCFTAG